MLSSLKKSLKIWDKIRRFVLPKFAMISNEISFKKEGEIGNIFEIIELKNRH